MWMDLAEATWATVSIRPLVLVPIGSLEQHGQHLPMDTDTRIAVAVTKAVSNRLDIRSVTTPPVAIGASGEHSEFPGTASIGGEGLKIVVVELVRSLRIWAGPVVLINGHGGNNRYLDEACAQLVDEGHEVSWEPCASRGRDPHAEHAETSILLYLSPWLVRRHLAEPGNGTPLRDLLPKLLRDGVRAHSPNGVLGDPTRATAAHGKQLLGEMVDTVVGRIQEGLEAGESSGVTT